MDDVIVFAPAPFSGLSKVPAAGGGARGADEGRGHRSHAPASRGSCREESASSTSRAPRARTERRTPPSRRSISRRASRRSWREKTAKAASCARLPRSSSATGNLLLQPFDPWSLKLSGPPIPVAEGVAFEAFRWIGNFTLLEHGTTRLPEQRCHPEEPPDLVRHRRQGARAGRRAANFFTIALSPDARRAAATVLVATVTRAPRSASTISSGASARVSPTEIRAQTFPIWSTDGRESHSATPARESGSSRPTAAPRGGSS